MTFTPRIIHDSAVHHACRSRVVRVTSLRPVGQPGGAMDRVWHRAAVLLLLGQMALQGVLGARQLSATHDETSHLPAGYSYLTTGDFRLNPQHPPLIKLLAALPLLALGAQIDREDPGWRSSPPDEWGFGERFLYRQDADRLLFWGRVPMILLGLVLAAYVYAWSRALFGPVAGLVSLALCSLSPTVLAHTRFVTFDVGLACFSTLAGFHLWRWLVQGGRVHGFLAGVGLGAALASKFSGVVFLPVFVLLVAARARARRDRAAALRDLGGLAAIVAVALVVVQASYFFSADPLVYWRGLVQVNRDHNPSFPYYLLGEFRAGGFWYYFPVAWALKTPVPTIVLLGWALVRLWRRRAHTLLDEACLALPALAFLLATCALADDLGVRYLLPADALLFIFAGRVAPVAGRLGKVALGALLLWQAAAAVAIYPDQLAYFNELAGGPSHGHRLLDDSNIDWGQDLKRLKIYMDEHGIGRIKLRYGRFSAPEYYGIAADPITDQEWAGTPPPGDYAFGTHLLIRGELYAKQQGLKTDWLSRYKPVGRVGYSIYVFKFE